jgi:molecular chaperone GrpE
MTEPKPMEDPAFPDAREPETEDVSEAGALADPAKEDDPLTLALQSIDALRNENAELKDRVLRGMADVENIRKRGEREKAEATLYAATNFARDLLPVVDTFKRALLAMPADQRDAADESTRNLLAGIELTERELLNVFERHGIRKIEPLGEKFDPNLHQAIFEVPTAAQPPGTVAEVVQSGFAIGNRCLRPAMVGVAKALPGDGPN